MITHEELCALLVARGVLKQEDVTPAPTYLKGKGDAATHDPIVPRDDESTPFLREMVEEDE